MSQALLVETFSELRTRFGTASWETQVLRGAWEGRSTLYHDNLTRFFVDVPDEPEHREFFKGFKELLKQRFQQADVWITSYPGITVDSPFAERSVNSAANRAQGWPNQVLRGIKRCHWRLLCFLQAWLTPVIASHRFS